MQKRVTLSWFSPVLAVLLLGACDSKPQAPIDSHEPEGVAILIEREGHEGPYVEGTSERFRVIASDEALSSIHWSATAGLIAPDAERVTWTLPAAGTASLVVSVQTESGKEAERTFTFQVDASSALASVVWGTGQHLLWLASQSAQYPGGLQDITVGSPLSSSTVKTYQVDAQSEASDLAYAGKPYIVERHGTNLELATPDARNFWTYTQLGTVQEGSHPSVAIRPTDGTPHVCFQRDDKVRFQ